MELRRAVEELRIPGDFLFELVDCPNSDEGITKRLDLYLEKLGLKCIGDGWREIVPGDATKRIKYVLRCDLAYGVPLMEEEAAGRIAERTVDLFAVTDARFFTNVSPVLSAEAWSPISEFTFDQGVVVITCEVIAIIWAFAED